ncbi:hypothetical protein JW906_04145 [bacterium]|nr:hypothetical protein [bacterium]
MNGLAAGGGVLKIQSILHLKGLGIRFIEIEVQARRLQGSRNGAEQASAAGSLAGEGDMPRHPRMRAPSSGFPETGVRGCVKIWDIFPHLKYYSIPENVYNILFSLDMDPCIQAGMFIANSPHILSVDDFEGLNT